MCLGMRPDSCLLPEWLWLLGAGPGCGTSTQAQGRQAQRADSQGIKRQRLGFEALACKRGAPAA